MTTKNFGPLVSGYLVPDGRNWETSVFQAGKPVLDKELNLAEDIGNGYGQLATRLSMPSGWVSKGFLAKADSTTEVYQLGTSNNLSIPGILTAQINGWVISVVNTYASGSNVISLGAGPSGVGERRFDLVILEVWRRLVAASPSVVGKSALGRIWRNGNVKIDPASDAVLNYPDDILDTNVGSETTKRVQIQYRLRVIQSIDLFAYPHGIDDPTVVARSVPAAAALPDGNATTFPYLNQSSAGDPGLWVAGDGDPTNTLGTVDGYMYAIPLVAVVRRNTSAFDKNTNHNGSAVAFPGTSDRPDGLFNNIVVLKDIIDLRMGINPNGWDFSEVLEKNVNRIFDNNLKSEFGTTAPQGAGCDGSVYLWADEIGITNAHGGDGVVTGDTPGAEFIGEFDSVRRAFSDRSIFEIATIRVPAPLTGWTNGTTFTIDPTALPIYPYTAYNWAAYNSAHVMFLDIVGARWMGPTGMSPQRLNFDAMSRIKTVTNLGVQPVGSLTVTLGNNVTATGLTDEPLYIDLLISYPPGLGLSKTPTQYHGISINNPAQMPATSPIYYNNLATSNAVHEPQRELRIQYNTVSINFSFVADTETSGSSSFRLPERAESIVSVNRNGAPIVGSTVLADDGRTVTLTNPADFTVPYDELSVQFIALRPMPQHDEQVTVYYDAASPQAVREANLPDNLTVIPRCISSRLYSITVGSGSQNDAYPFPVAYNQTGGVFPSSTYTFSGEHELAAREDIAITDFNADTGFLQLPVFVGYVPWPDDVVFNRSVGDVDVEGRSFYKAVPSVAHYIPNAYAQDLSDAKRHKVVLPMLAELASDSVFGYKGELVVVLIMRWARFDKTNGVWFDPDLTANTTTACVFRTQGNLLNGKI